MLFTIYSYHGNLVSPAFRDCMEGPECRHEPWRLGEQRHRAASLVYKGMAKGPVTYEGGSESLLMCGCPRSRALCRILVFSYQKRVASSPVESLSQIVGELMQLQDCQYNSPGCTLDDMDTSNHKSDSRGLHRVVWQLACWFEP